MEDHASWIAIVAMAISALGTGWAGWLQLQNNKLKAEQDNAKNEIQRAKKIADERDDKTDGRVDLWVKSNLRRGSIRAVESDMARPKDPQMNNLIVTDPQVREAYQPLVPFLKQIRQKYPDEIRFSEKLLEDHGDWLILHICKPLGVGEYECLAMAFSVSGEDTKEHRIAALPPVS